MLAAIVPPSPLVAQWACCRDSPSRRRRKVIHWQSKLCLFYTASRPLKHTDMDQTHMDSTDARLDAMTAADFGTVARLGEVIWRSHYTKIIGSAQVDYMLADRYTPEKLSLYLDADDRWLMLLRVDSPTLRIDTQTARRAVGYCSYALTDDPGETKLEQLYLLPESHGKGLGRLMLCHVEEQARVRGRSMLLLQTNKRNAGAIAFYRKAGFTVREEVVFDIGNGFVMDDYVMEKVL